jgi:undecaprenyl-diphosphatase
VIVTRSPSDVLRFVVGVVSMLVLLLVEWLFGNTLVTFASDLLRGFQAIPRWIVDVLAVAGRISGWRMLGTVVAAAALGAVLVLLLDGIVDVADGDLVTKLSTGLGPATDPRFPSVVGIGITSAVVTAAAPWLSRGWRRWAWVLVFGLVFTRFVTSPLSFDSVQALLIGWLAGAAVLVLLGAPMRRPTPDAIVEGLDRSGLPIATLEPASVDARGSTPYFGVGADG